MCLAGCYCSQNLLQLCVTGRHLEAQVLCPRGQTGLSRMGRGRVHVSGTTKAGENMHLILPEFFIHFLPSLSMVTVTFCFMWQSCFLCFPLGLQMLPGGLAHRKAPFHRQDFYRTFKGRLYLISGPKARREDAKYFSYLYKIGCKMSGPKKSERDSKYHFPLEGRTSVLKALPLNWLKTYLLNSYWTSTLLHQRQVKTWIRGEIQPKSQSHDHKLKTLGPISNAFSLWGHQEVEIQVGCS